MLARIRKAMDENEQGFTLIELLVVMIIIGILAAIAIPVFLNQRKNAVDASYKSDLRTVANEMESYYTDNEVYPATAPSNGCGRRGSSPVSVALRASASRRTPRSLSRTTPARPDAYCILASNASGKGSHDWIYVCCAGWPPAGGQHHLPGGAF